MFNEVTKSIKWNNELLELSTGKFARQADGAVMVRMGKSAVLCTVVSEKEAKEGTDFFPLTVNYQEKAYAAGKIPGGFFKRETGRSEKETLVSRLIDRPIRPLFYPGFRNETQILCNVHSLDDSKGNIDILALIGASAALAISGIPFIKVIAGSRVGVVDDQLVLNPTPEQIKKSHLDLIVAGTKDSVMMVESEANFLQETRMLEAIEFGHKAFQSIIELIEQLKSSAGKKSWNILYNQDIIQNLQEQVRKLVGSNITDAFTIKSKQDRCAAINAIKTTVKSHFMLDSATKYSEQQIDLALSKVQTQILRTQTINKKIRIDGRALDEVRDIECEVSLFQGTHGSALFTRGETQSLVSTTLGTSQDEQIIDNIEGEYKERFLLNYIFPQYSVGEIGAMRAPSRREIGHGRLAWKALRSTLPSKIEFPYTVRVVSEITESNGSSSMATVCGASMSMMDAGVPLKHPISGIAMGLIKEDNDFVILSDIIADEDHFGDMDFKVAGNSDGITALQMDIKVSGITFNIMKEALEQAKVGRVHILSKMNKLIKKESSISTDAPIIETFTVKKDKIRDIIGPGGKVIREICDITSAKIDITDEGKVSISAIGKDNLDNAIARVKEIAIDPKIGDMFEGTVVKILEVGAFVNYSGSRDGFVHISEISNERIDSVSTCLNQGQKVKVKLIGFDRGRAKLTIKDANLKVLSKKVVHQHSKEKNLLNKESMSDAPISNEQEKNLNSTKRRNNNKNSKDRELSSDEVTERKYFS